LLDAFGLRGFENKPGMMIFRDAINDFGIVVGLGIRMLLTGERKNHAGIVAAGGGKLVRLLACSNFEAGPFAPKVNVGGGFDHVGDVGTADAGGDFDEIELAISVRFQKFGVGDAAEIAETFDDLAIYLEKLFGVVKTPP
jgi:hypothetical protein